MTASTMQLTTRLRTWALVAGLTGLLIAFGARSASGAFTRAATPPSPKL